MANFIDKLIQKKVTNKPPPIERALSYNLLFIFSANMTITFQEYT